MGKTRIIPHAGQPSGRFSVFPDVAQQASDVAPVKETSKKAPAKPAKRARAQKGAKAAKSSNEERSNKKADVIAMMKRAKGATLAEIMDATGWQKPRDAAS